MGRAGFHEDYLAGGQSPHLAHPTWDPYLLLTGFGMGIFQSLHHQIRISNDGLWPFAEGHGIQATQISGSPFRFGPPFRLQHQLQGHHQAIEPSAINHHMVNPELVGDLGLHGEVTIGMNIKRDTWVTHPWSRHHYCRKTALASVQNRNGISDHAVETNTAPHGQRLQQPAGGSRIKQLQDYDVQRKTSTDKTHYSIDMRCGSPAHQS